MPPQGWVVIDSTVDVPAGIEDFTVVPCLVSIGNQTFRDGVDLTREAYYRLIRDTREMPHTSQPPPGVFEEVFRQLTDDGSEIVSIHSASALSGIFNSASVAAANLPDRRIHLVDSCTTSLGAGWLAVEAAQAIRQGATAEEAADLARAWVPQVRLMAALGSLEYVRRGGRVNWAAAFLGELLRIKPLITAIHGEVLLLERPRTMQRAMQQMLASALECGTWKRVGVVHADAPDLAEKMLTMVTQYFPLDKVVKVEAGTALSSHTGPGTVGLTVLLEAEQGSMAGRKTTSR